MLKGMINFGDAVTPAAIGEVPEETAIAPFDTIITPNGPITSLMQLRNEFPFVPIMPYPNLMAGVVLAAGVAQDLNFPDGTQLFILSSNADFYACIHGSAELPTAANVQNNRSVFKPDYCWFYANARNISVIAPNANTFVQALCYAPTKLPSLNR